MKRPDLTPYSYDQERIYDERYGGDYNGMGGPITHLTAENLAMTNIIQRLRLSKPNRKRITMFDYGYGVGRVPNKFLCEWTGVEEILVIAYDVSKVGLLKAMDAMSNHLPTVTRYDGSDRLVGECTSARDDPGPRRTIRFIHGKASFSPQQISELAIEENGGPFDISTCWYDAIGHDPSPEKRVQTFHMLGSMTDPRGEVAATVSTIGDLDPQDETEEIYDLEVEDEDTRDVVYRTEIEHLYNYLHLFGPDFALSMQATRTKSTQNVWLQPIRMLGPIYETTVAEEEAFGLLTSWDRKQRENPWAKKDYEAIHTVGGFRSAQLPPYNRFLLP